MNDRTHREKDGIGMNGVGFRIRFWNSKNFGFGFCLIPSQTDSELMEIGLVMEARCEPLGDLDWNHRSTGYVKTRNSKYGYLEFALLFNGIYFLVLVFSWS